MDDSDLVVKQRRLGSLRRAIAACWMFTVFAVLSAVGWAGLRIRANVNDLVLPGPARQKTMADVEARVRQSLGPKLKADAARAMRDLQPILRQDVAAVDAQAPTVALAAVNGLKRFRDDLPGVFAGNGQPASAARPYQVEISQILNSLTKIRDQEAPNVKGVAPTWDMDLMVLEEMHREIAAVRGVTK